MNIHLSIPAAPTSKGEGWTKARVKLVRDLWPGDMSASEIAREIGGGLSRNAVIGKAHRLGLAGRPQAPRKPRKVGGDRGGGTLQRLRSKQDQFFAPEPDTRPVRAADVVPLHLKLSDLPLGACHWPYGDGPFTFCGHTVLPEQPYCRAHDRLAHSSAVEISEAERARRSALGKRSTASNRRNGNFA